MAQVVRLVDDIDPAIEDGVETVQISYGGTDYEIDLGKEHRDTLDEVMKNWLAHARRVGATSGRLARGHGAATGTRPARRDRAQTGHIRQWARDQGMEISERGRIPADVMAKYQQAH